MAEKTGKFTEEKIRGVRKRIAEHMSMSSRENASFMLSRRADVTELLKLRKEKKIENEGKDMVFPSINDLIIKATALALKKHPKLNSTFQNEMIRIYEDINICEAVALPEGLITPVIPTVDKLSVWEICKLTKEKAEKAKTGTLTMEEIMGGTFTVTNVGNIKVEVANPIINPPQVAILAAGTIVPELQMVDGQVVERSKMFLSLTIDHRIVDGYPGALFLNSVCHYLENSEVLWE